VHVPSRVYRALVREHFPKAKIAADRSHVNRLISHHFPAAVNGIEPESRGETRGKTRLQHHLRRLARYAGNDLQTVENAGRAAEI
jgi:transposase